MKIVIVANGSFFSSYGGGQVYVTNLVDALIDSGQEVSVIAYAGSAPSVARKSYRGIDLFEFSSFGLKDELKEIILQKAPDVIHIHSFKDFFCRIAVELNIPAVVTAHHGGIYCPDTMAMDNNDRKCIAEVSVKQCLSCMLRFIPPGPKLWYPLMRWIPEDKYIKLGEKMARRKFILGVTPLACAASFIENTRRKWRDIVAGCARIVAPCRDVATALENNGMPAEKIRVIPHGIPLPTIRPEFPEIHDGKLKFYCVGRICYVKGLHILLDAFHRVKNPDIELHLVGGAERENEKALMRKLQKKYGSDSRIVWHGKVEPRQVFDLTKDFHIGVSASIYLEVFGLNIAESLALGKPVLATRNGGAEIQIEDGVNGWLVPSNDVDALRAKIEEVVATPWPRLKEMSARCHAISIQDHCAALLRLYAEL